MMSEAHSQMMYYLIGFIVVLFAVIVGTLVLSQLSKKKESKEPLRAKVGDEVQSEVVGSGAKSEELLGKAEVEVSLSSALAATEAQLFGRIRKLFSQSQKNSVLDDIEEILYTSDLGPKTVQRLMASLNDQLNKSELSDYEKIRRTLAAEISAIFSNLQRRNILETIGNSKQQPFVLLIVGVNGAGKTTTIGKLSSYFAQKNKKVLVAAGDTFRAAAGGQLKVWTDRAQVEIFSPEGVSDPSAVAFDAVSKAKAQQYDLVIIDTAGRLHTQANLMEELKKLKRVITKVIPDAPHEILIVLDANSGQNALIQAKEYHQALELTGAVLTKMDGTAKGGVAVGLAHELNLPVELIGVGERIQDLRPFNADEYVRSIVGQ